tara:strand:+ start:1660 stop:1938 length:279 start_codon:yes stop_codon:yes gene_type:complete
MNKNSNFGETAAENFSIGDIVEWSKWNVEKNNWDMYYGIVLSIKNEIKSNRLVSISKVLPFDGKGFEKEFFTLSLRLVSPTKREELSNDIKN